MISEKIKVFMIKGGAPKAGRTMEATSVINQATTK